MRLESTEITDNTDSQLKEFLGADLCGRDLQLVLKVPDTALVPDLFGTHDNIDAENKRSSVQAYKRTRVQAFKRTAHAAGRYSVGTGLAAYCRVDGGAV